jgi:hypothetical protein
MNKTPQYLQASKHIDSYYCPMLPFAAETINTLPGRSPMAGRRLYMFAYVNIWVADSNNCPKMWPITEIFSRHHNDAYRGHGNPFGDSQGMNADISAILLFKMNVSKAVRDVTS